MSGRDGYRITTRREEMDLDVIHGFLAHSYWAEGIPRALVERSIEHSLCFAVLLGARQVGFARVISDRATFAYLADVFVLEGHRGRGLGRKLVEAALGHPELQDVRRFLLRTKDAHGVYAPVGFRALLTPERWMEKPVRERYRGHPAT